MIYQILGQRLYGSDGEKGMSIFESAKWSTDDCMILLFILVFVYTS